MSRMKGVAKCRFLFKPPAERGWGDIDQSEVQDYGDSNWEPDEAFQLRSGDARVGRSSGWASPSVQRPRQTRRAHRPPRQDRCTLIFDVPKKLEYVARSECLSLWPKSSLSSILGKVEVTLQSPEDIARATELKTVLGSRVLVHDGQGFFSDSNSMESVLGKLRSHVERMPWILPLQAWAELAEDGRTYNPWSDVDTWFPFPSYKVVCITPEGDYICNYDQICRAFAQGLNITFPKWSQNPMSPSFIILLEISDPDLKVYINLKPVTIVSPLIEPFHRLNDSAVAHTIFQLTKVKPGEILLNCTCSQLDVTEEALRVQREIIHTVVCDSNWTSVSSCLKDAGQWSDMHQGDGNICQSNALPYREDSVDIVVGMLTASGNSRIISKTLIKRLQEMARVCRKGTGRVCFLTDQSDVVDGLLSKRGNWLKVSKHETSFGYFSTTVYILHRSYTSVAASSSSAIETSLPYPPGLSFQGRIRRHRRSMSPTNDVPPGMQEMMATASGYGYHGSSLQVSTEEEMDWSENI